LALAVFQRRETQPDPTQGRQGQIGGFVFDVVVAA
jgi:hypothetical protein